MMTKIFDLGFQESDVKLLLMVVQKTFYRVNNRSAWYFCLTVADV